MAGRPKKPEGETRTYMLRIMLTPAEREELERAAKERSLDTSAWARSVLLSLAREQMGKKEN